MKILAIGDFHGKVPKNLKRVVDENNIDLILCTGDICSHDRIEWKYWSRLRTGEKLVDILGKKKMRDALSKEVAKSRKAFKLLDGLNVPLILVYGNGDITDEYLKRNNINAKGIESIAKACKNIRLVRCGRIEFRGYTVLCHSGYRGYTAKKGDANGKFPDRAKKINLKWKNDMKTLSKRAKGDFIFLTHDVPLWKLDMVKSRKSPAFGEHIGDKFYLDFDRKYQPMLHICGHMHENQGKERIRRTVVVNSGFGGRGQAAIIDLPEIKITFI